MAKPDVEEELTLPKRTMVRLAEGFLPTGLTLHPDTHDLIVRFGLEFIRLLTSQANDICEEESNNGFLRLCHVLKACESLGFEEYGPDIEAVAADYEQRLKRMQKKRAEKVEWWVKSQDTDDLGRLQAEMLERSRARFEMTLQN